MLFRSRSCGWLPPCAPRLLRSPEDRLDAVSSRLPLSSQRLGTLSTLPCAHTLTLARFSLSPLSHARARTHTYTHTQTHASHRPAGGPGARARGAGGGRRAPPPPTPRAPASRARRAGSEAWSRAAAAPRQRPPVSRAVAPTSDLPFSTADSAPLPSALPLCLAATAAEIDAPAWTKCSKAHFRLPCRSQIGRAHV